MTFLLRGTSYSGPVTIKFDSIYAYKMATGKWKPQSNIALIQQVNALVRQVCGHRQVFWQHVYGHTGVEGNERADKAAARGAQGQSHFWPLLRLQKCPPQHFFHPPPTVEDQTLPPDVPFTWAQFADVLVNTVEQQVGRSKPKKTPLILQRVATRTHSHVALSPSSKVARTPESQGSPLGTFHSSAISSHYTGNPRFQTIVQKPLGAWCDPPTRTSHGHS